MPYADPDIKKQKDRDYYLTHTLPKRRAAQLRRDEESADPRPTGPRAMIHVKVAEADKVAVQARLSSDTGNGTLPQTTLNAVVAAHFAALAEGKTVRYITPKGTKKT